MFVGQIHDVFREAIQLAFNFVRAFAGGLGAELFHLGLHALLQAFVGGVGDRGLKGSRDPVEGFFVVRPRVSGNDDVLEFLGRIQRVLVVALLRFRFRPHPEEEPRLVHRLAREEGKHELLANVLLYRHVAQSGRQTGRSFVYGSVVPNAQIR